MSMPSKLRQAHTRRVIAVVVALILAAWVLPADAAPGDLPSPAAAPGPQGPPAALAAVAAVPGQSDLPSTRITSFIPGIATLTQVSAVRSSKIFLTIKPEDPVWAAVYPTLYNFPIGDPNPTSYRATCNGRQGTPCVPFPFDQPECATEDPATQVKGVYIRSEAYPLEPVAGGGAVVGKLAETDVNLVAFGSIPATATVTLTLPRVDGQVQPLKIHDWEYPGGTGNDRFGCDPMFFQTISGTRVEVLIEGQIEIALSDLVIDGVPVDVGSSCRTESLADLKLWSDNAAGDYFPLGGGPVGAWDGLEVGSVFPLNSPLYDAEDQGRMLEPSTGLTIPPFTGCGTGGEDLSSIVTAMASGPNNPISVTQGSLVLHEWTDYSVDLSDVKRCQQVVGGENCPFPGPRIPPNPPLPGGEVPRP